MSVRQMWQKLGKDGRELGKEVKMVVYNQEEKNHLPIITNIMGKIITFIFATPKKKNVRGKSNFY